MTCFDQAPNALAWLEKGEVVEGDAKGFVGALSDASGMPPVAQFWSPENGIQSQKIASKEGVVA